MTVIFIDLTLVQKFEYVDKKDYNLFLDSTDESDDDYSYITKLIENKEELNYAL